MSLAKLPKNIEIPAPIFAELAEKQAEEEPPVEFTIERTKYLGEMRANYCRFQSKLKITVMKLSRKEWTEIPLFNTQIVVVSSRIESPVEKKITEEKKPVAFIGINKNQRYCLFVRIKGQFIISLKIFVNFLTKRNQAVKFDIPYSRENTVEFRIIGDDEMHVSCDKAIKENQKFAVKEKDPDLSSDQEKSDDSNWDNFDDYDKKFQHFKDNDFDSDSENDFKFDQIKKLDLKLDQNKHLDDKKQQIFDMDKANDFNSENSMKQDKDMMSIPVQTTRNKPVLKDKMISYDEMSDEDQDEDQDESESGNENENESENISFDQNESDEDILIMNNNNETSTKYSFENKKNSHDIFGDDDDEFFIEPQEQRQDDSFSFKTEAVPNDDLFLQAEDEPIPFTGGLSTNNNSNNNIDDLFGDNNINNNIDGLFGDNNMNNMNNNIDDDLFGNTNSNINNMSFNRRSPRNSNIQQQNAFISQLTQNQNQIQSREQTISQFMLQPSVQQNPEIGEKFLGLLNELKKTRNNEPPQPMIQQSQMMLPNQQHEFNRPIQQQAFPSQQMAIPQQQYQMNQTNEFGFFGGNQMNQMNQQFQPYQQTQNYQFPMNQMNQMNQYQQNPFEFDQSNIPYLYNQNQNQNQNQQYQQYQQNPFDFNQNIRQNRRDRTRSSIKNIRSPQLSQNKFIQQIDQFIPFDNEKENFFGRDNKPLFGNGHTLFHCHVPSLNYLQISWTEKSSYDILHPTSQVSQVSAPKIEKSKMISVEQSATHVILENVITTKSSFQFTITNFATSSLEIAIPNKKQFKIVSVIGDLLEKWEIIKIKNEDEDEDENEENNQLRIKAFFKEKIQGDYILEIDSETDFMIDQKCQVEIPILRSATKVQREKGFISVKSEVDFEVRIANQKGLTTIPPKELPRKISDSSVIYAFKFLDPQVDLVLDFIKHPFSGKLVSSIENGNITTVCSPNGSFMYRCVLSIRNPEKQFLKLKFPSDEKDNSDKQEFTIWSTIVSENPVKPVKTKENEYLIPLIKTQLETFQTEIIFISKTKSMQKQGKLTVHFPQFDLPLNYLLISLYVPENYNYTEFTGDLKEVKDINAESKISFKSPSFSKTMPSRRRKKGLSFMQKKENALIPIETTKYVNPQVAGLLPVKIDEIKSGRVFYFKKMIVQNQFLQTSIEYQEIVKPFYQRRRLISNTKKRLIYFSIIFLIFISLIFLWRFFRK
ncbi:hypothetical protein M0811_09087 [Anaeramoeba ignava]|uniref:Transmembrane protein n=1 Tax=Anaeramoeba ignava TaxID=1746090 RepID=A0A9Q0LHW3_ANAIG|nr:hypothetical protein M0811_09087 [Anaeramoeba ignava]